MVACRLVKVFTAFRCAHAAKCGQYLFLGGGEMIGLRALLLACAAIALTGCATAPQKAEELAATHGFVQVVIPQLGTPLSPLAVRSTAETTLHHLQPIAEGDGTVRGIWLPAGQYKLAAWVHSRVSDYPAFEVRARRLTNLGTLIPVALGGKEMTLLPVQDANSEKLGRETAQRLGQLLAEPDALPWRPQEVPKPFFIDPGYSGLGLIADLIVLYDQHLNQTPISKRLRQAKTSAEMLAVAKEAAAPATKEPGVDNQGRLYFGAALGQVRVRTPAGAWSSMDTGGLRAITAVEWRGGQLFVGDESGEIRSSRDDGRTWSRLASLGQRTVVTDIDRVGSRWVVLAADHRAAANGMFNQMDRIRAYVASRDDMADLKQVWEATSKDAFFVGNSWNGPRGESTDRSYLFPAFFDLMRLDNSSFEVRRVPGPARVSGVHAFPQGTVTAFYAMGAFSKLYVSPDHGDTWATLDEPSLIIDDVVFETPQRGVVARWPMAAFTPRVVFENYDSVTKKWVAQEAGPEACRLVLQDARKLPNLCVTGSGSVLHRSVKGWGVEFSAE